MYISSYFFAGRFLERIPISWMSTVFILVGSFSLAAMIYYHSRSGAESSARRVFDSKSLRPSHTSRQKKISFHRRLSWSVEDSARSTTFVLISISLLAFSELTTTQSRPTSSPLSQTHLCIYPNVPACARQISARGFSLVLLVQQDMKML